MRDVVSPAGRPIGPVWFGGMATFLGADGRLGRDEMVRLMYGGRTSLFIGFASALITATLATLFGLLSGYYRGWTDTVISRAMDVIWAFPGAAARDSAWGLAGGRRRADRSVCTFPSGSIWIPILIIGFVSVPYMARPLRGEVFSPYVKRSSSRQRSHRGQAHYE